MRFLRHGEWNNGGSVKEDFLLRLMRALIPFGNIMIFCYVWALYYNEKTFEGFWYQGMLICAALYILIYYAFGKLYRAFKINIAGTGELMLSQFLAIGMSDFVMYMVCYLTHMRFANPLPGLIAAAIQLIVTCFLIKVNKASIAKYIPPQSAIFIYGAKMQLRAEHIETSAEQLINKLKKKHSDLFEIQEVCSDTQESSELVGKIADYEAVILCHVSQKLRARLLAVCAEKGKSVYVTPKLEDIMLMNYEYNSMTDTPMLMLPARRDGYKGKRFLDIGMSVLMLLIFSPFMLLAALCIKLEDGGPILYRQRRVTQNGREFDMLKFRSMIVDAEKQGYMPAVQKDSRITKTGKFIRATRFDETPQLFNILKGDMSIVGPRPERIEHVQKYTENLPEFSYRLRVRGGLTGYAQIYGKYNTSAEDKLKMDLMYIEKQSLLLDLQLILLTVKVIFMRESTEGF